VKSILLIIVLPLLLLANTREELVRFIFHDYVLPTGYPTVEENITDPKWNEDCISDISRLTDSMSNGFISVMYHFHPVNARNEMVVYHQGHRGGFDKGKKTILRLLQNGFDVIGVSMPLKGMNSKPFRRHNDMEKLESDTLCPIEYFIDPVITALNYSCRQNVAMVGISGGGWTTVLSAALDYRVTESFSVSGSAPLRYRNRRDYEQTLPGLYEISGYEELYRLAADNGLHCQIVNVFDPCCFAGRFYCDYEKRVQEETSGEFMVFADSTHRKHCISDVAMNFIIEKMMNQ